MFLSLFTCQVVSNSLWPGGWQHASLTVAHHLDWSDTHCLMCLSDTCYIECEIHAEEEWEFVTGLCWYPHVFDFQHIAVYFSLLHVPSYLKHSEFWFPWHDKLRLKLTIFSALLLYAARCWSTLTLFSFLIPVLACSVLSVQFSRSVVSDSLRPRGQPSLSIPSSRSLLKLMPIESVMPSSHLILCRPLLLLPSIGFAYF